MPDIPKILVVDSKKTLEKVVDTIYLQAPVSNGTILFIALLSFFILKNYSDSVLHVIWPSIMVVVAIYRLFLWYQRKSSADSQTASYWINHYILATIIAGFSWGSLFFLSYVNHNDILYITLLMVFFGVTASAISVLSASLTAFFGYTLPIFTCFIISIFNLNNPNYLYLIIAVIAYYVMLSLLARNSNQQIIQSINLQLQNKNLITKLRQEIGQRESLIKSRTKQLEQSNQNILDSENRLQNVINGAELGYWDWDFQTGYLVVNQRWLEILGLTHSDIQNNVSDWESRIHPEDKQKIMSTVEDAIKNNKPYVADFRMKHKDGHWVWIQGSGSVIERCPDSGKVKKLCGIHQNIEERKEAEHLLKEMSTHDFLTGLFNRQEMERYFVKELERSKRHKRSVSVFMIDIDYFKNINDTYGHKAGDIALQYLAKHMSNEVRNIDFVSRYGGEEFVIILPETAVESSIELAERLRESIANIQVPIHSKYTQITISIGVSTFPDNSHHYEELLNKADAALYEAKNSGRNCVRHASKIMKTKLYSIQMDKKN